MKDVRINKISQLMVSKGIRFGTFLVCWEEVLIQHKFKLV